MRIAFNGCLYKSACCAPVKRHSLTSLRRPCNPAHRHVGFTFLSLDPGLPIDHNGNRSWGCSVAGKPVWPCRQHNSGKKRARQASRPLTPSAPFGRQCGGSAQRSSDLGRDASKTAVSFHWEGHRSEARTGAGAFSPRFFLWRLARGRVTVPITH